MTPQEQSDFIDLTKEKAIQAQTGMWNMEASVFGLILAAASIVAAIQNATVNKWHLLALVGICFFGVLLLLGCYRKQKQSYVLVLRIASGHVRAEDPKELLAKGERLGDCVQLYERLSHIVLYVALVDFCLFCWLTL